MDPRFYQKILQNYGFFFQKNLRYLKSKISTKFNRLLFFLQFFSIFGIFFLFHLSKLVQKLWNFLQCFIGRVGDFTNDFWKILKLLLKKILISEIYFFKILRFSICFFQFFIIFDILFSISSICTCQKIIEIFMLFYFMDQRFYQRFLENHGIFF